jgi:sterol 3beta-glucosyltransferase
VAIATHEEFRVLVEGVPGCSFVALDGSPTTDMRQFPAAFVQGVISEEIAFSKQVAQSQAKNKRKIFDGAKAFGANFMVSMMSCHLECTSVAARLGVPSVVCSTYPLYPSAERVPMSMMANEREFPVVVARFFSWIGFKVAWSMAKGEMNAWRAELGLEPLSGISWDMCPVVNLYSSTLAPRPRDWPRHVHDGGFCVMHDVDGDAAPFAPTPELQEFLGSGGPPIYFGFGSMPAMGGMAQVRLFVQACTRLQRRGLVSAPGVAEADRGGVLTEDVRWIGSVPHEWLFPHCAAAVHHGGAGTTAATLRAGIPCERFRERDSWR